MIKTLFRIFMALRMGLLGLVVTGAAWVILAPPTKAEATLMGIAPETNAYESLPLMQMRYAKALIAFAPDRMLRTMAERSDGEFTEAEIETALQDVAKGPPASVPVRGTAAKFESVPRN